MGARVSYILMIRERLEKMAELVEENVSRAQKQQKEWYDRNARSREFHPGDQVLVLLPTSTNKMLARWQGPYEVARRCGKVNYEVRMCDRRKQYKIFHVNMLRVWYPPVDVAGVAIEAVEDEEIVVWKEGKMGGDWRRPEQEAEERAASGAGGVC